MLNVDCSPEEASPRLSVATTLYEITLPPGSDGIVPSHVLAPAFVITISLCGFPLSVHCRDADSTPARPGSTGSQSTISACTGKGPLLNVLFNRVVDRTSGAILEVTVNEYHQLYAATSSESSPKPPYATHPRLVVAP